REGGPTPLRAEELLLVTEPPGIRSRATFPSIGRVLSREGILLNRDLDLRLVRIPGGDHPLHRSALVVHDQTIARHGWIEPDMDSPGCASRCELLQLSALLFSLSCIVTRPVINA